MPTPIIGSGATRVNFRFVRGVNFSPILTMRSKSTGQVIDITDFTFGGGIVDSAGVSIQTFAFVKVSAVGGKFQPIVTDVQTLALTSGNQFAYITYDDADGQTFLFMEGQALIRNIGED